MLVVTNRVPANLLRLKKGAREKLQLKKTKGMMKLNKGMPTSISQASENPIWQLCFFICLKVTTLLLILINWFGYTELPPGKAGAG
jgi:hypothetical protein